MTTQPTREPTGGSRRAVARAMRVVAPRVLVTDLERFWPSRRGHAFDEFCR